MIIFAGKYFIHSIHAEAANATNITKQVITIPKMPSWITDPQGFGEKVRSINPESRFAIIGQATEVK